MVRLFAGLFICLYAGLLVNAGLIQILARKATGQQLLAAGVGLVCLAAAFVLLCRPLRQPRPGKRIGAGVASFYLGMILGAWLQKQTGQTQPSVLQMVVTSLSFQIAGIILIAALVREHRTTWNEAFGFGTQPQQAVLYGFILAGLALPIGWLLQHLSVELLQHIPGFKPEEQDAIQILRMAKTVGARTLLGIITIVLAPLAEEFLFRGVLYPWIRQFGFPRIAVLVTAIVFATMHFHLATFVPLALLSVGLTWIYQRTGNLLACIAAHATFNAMNFSLLLIMERMGAASPWK